MNIVRNSIVIFAAKVLLSLFIFSTAILIARVLGPRGLGIYSLFLAVIGLAVNLGSFGLGSASLYLLNREKREASVLFSNALIFGFIWGLVIAALLVFVSFLFPYVVFSIPTIYLLTAFLIIPFHLLHIYLLPFFLAKLETLWWSFISVFYTFSMFLGTFVALFFFELGVPGAVLAIAQSSVSTFFVLLLVLLKKYKLRFRPDFGVFKEQFHFGLRSYLAELFNTIHFKFNIFMGSFFMTVVPIGYLAAAFHTVGVLFFIPFSFQQVLSPVWSLQPVSQVDEATPKAARQAFLVALVSAVVFWLLSKPIVLLLFGEQFLASLPSLLLLLPGFVAGVLGGIFFNSFFARGKPQLASIILVPALLLNAALNLVLIPLWGIEGIAIAVSVSLLGASLAAAFLFARISHSSLDSLFLIRAQDLKSLLFQFKEVLHGKKLMRKEGLTLEKLKDFYEKKALGEGPSILRDSFDSPSLFKRLFYAVRVHTIMKFLDVKPEHRVLEIGCGIGYYTRKIAENTRNLVATDISEHYVQMAKSQNPYPTEQYVACPVEKIPFSDNSFDKVLMSEVIEHLIDPEKGVQEIQRVLKPGGRAVIATPNANSYLNILYHVCLLFGGTHFDQDHMHEFSGKELHTLLSKYFVVTKEKYVNYFPVFLPQIVVKLLRYERVRKFISGIEDLFNSIPVLRKTGFSMVFQVEKK